MATKNDTTKKIEEVRQEINKLDKDLGLVKYKIDEVTDDVEKLIKLTNTLDHAVARLKERVEPLIGGAKVGVGVVLVAVLTALTALVIK